MDKSISGSQPGFPDQHEVLVVDSDGTLSEKSVTRLKVITRMRRNWRGGAAQLVEGAQGAAIRSRTSTVRLDNLSGATVAKSPPSV
ncbi:hypothetical protein KFL_004980020 [Klebsormidium nitens]|uniref:Uncharacterized protein n=1 Tax=Klebsormidium nitens TaxID=105231 RepID=A0A1Y1IE25_KLENI|nr:hypothetical protein KFL_004980020 [Klebsormidium nitens]|eukprot:GAQ89214.1 hypothetical protein KFL_004980020 [Klebsormidium nitens]